MTDNADPWTTDIPNAVHNALALVRSKAAKNAGTANYIDEWYAIYGHLQFQLDAEAINRALQSGSPHQVLAVVSEQFTDQIRKVMSTHVHANSEIELRLVELLASATGRSTDAVLDELDAWAVERET